mmetsp:Transcript_52107/g.63815  ORF Transcript_52107/g.63815 Transcript_52107/m.63815 type:complete len:281 (+) Transcript_52107:45-887(+)
MAKSPAAPLPLQRGRHKAGSQSGPSTPTGSLRTTTIRSGSPHSQNSPVASNASREDGEGHQREHVQCLAAHDAPDARTPRVLWASTPTPKANQSYSFALPLDQSTVAAGKLNADAVTFIPDGQRLQVKEGEIPQVLPGPLHSSEPSEFHAEAQAVMMAESVLGLDAEPKQLQVAQVSSCKTGGDDVKERVEQNLGDSVPERLPSKGSAFHQQGLCRPCAWMWKPRGCQNAAICEYCHLCPEGELKHRKKLKIAAIRMGALAALPSQEGTARRGLKLSTLL